SSAISSSIPYASGSRLRTAGRPTPSAGTAGFYAAIALAAQGTPVNAAMDGRVTSVGFNATTYGNYIIITHSGGYQII
ncbi:MAG: peptidoglycan DD-metalloendopeptidase family protein, partial [Treponema sp.]|nr:peptidoglycan DD-metalloendopeptidase family protein [Treponema sp.]